MPEKRAKQEARRRKRQGKSPSTQAGEFVHQEIRHVREGKHGARSPQQAIAIGLSKARRAGVKVPRKGRSGSSRSGSSRSRRRRSPARSRAAERALRSEPRGTTSRSSLSRQARGAARRRGAADRSRAARKAARTRSRRR